MGTLIGLSALPTVTYSPGTKAYCAVGSADTVFRTAVSAAADNPEIALRASGFVIRKLIKTGRLAGSSFFPPYASLKSVANCSGFLMVSPKIVVTTSPVILNFLFFSFNAPEALRSLIICPILAVDIS